MTPSNANEFISRSLLPWKWRIYSAHVASIALGILAACLGSLVGPGMLAMFSSSQNSIPLVNVLGPLMSKWVSEYLGYESIPQSVFFTYLPWFIVTVVTLKSLALFYQWYTWEWIGEQIAWSWRKELAAKFTNLDSEKRELDTVKTYEERLGSSVTQDIKNLREFIVHYYGGLPREGLQVFFTGLVIVLLSPKLFAIFALFVAPIGILVSRIGRKIRRRAGRALENNASLTEWIQQRLLGLESIKHYQSERFEVDQMSFNSHSLFQKLMSAAKVKSRTSPIIEFFGVLAMSIALAVAIKDVSLGLIAGPIVLSFFGNLALFAQSASKLGRYFNSNQEGKAAAIRLFNLNQALDQNKSESSTENLSSHIQFEPDVKTSLKLSNINVSYRTSSLDEVTALKNFSFEFLGGKVYCLIGKSGAGKSTVFNAILGLCRRQSGTISGRFAPLFSDRSLDICSIPQSMPVIPTSLERNVSYPLIFANSQKAQQALDRAHFNLDKNRLPQGAQTLVGPGNLQMSGGQIQRIHLARIAYHKAPIVLIDEGTSALDPQTEKEVLAMIQDIAKQGACILMIAHRKKAAEISDELLILKNGQLETSGSTASLIESKYCKEVFG